MRKNSTLTIGANKKVFSAGLKALLLIFFVFACGIFFEANSQTVGIKSTGILASDLGESMTGYHILYLTLTPADENGTGIIDGSFVLSQGEVVAWSDYSICVRFLNKGRNPYIDLRNGGGFAVDDTVSFNFGESYKCWIETTVSDLKYSVYIQSPEMRDPVKIGSDYAYRNTAITELAIWSCVFNPNNNNENTVVAETLAYVDAIGNPNGISNRSNNQLKVFPNPTNDAFQLNLKGNFSYRLFDLSGMLKLSGTENNRAIFGEGLSKGVYILKVEQARRINLMKVVKY
jgi:hypothetical protein